MTNIPDNTISLREFEPSLKELESIVQQLERGDTTLEHALTAFERGITLTRSCQRMLDHAEQRIKIVLSDSEQMTTGTEFSNGLH